MKKHPIIPVSHSIPTSRGTRNRVVRGEDLGFIFIQIGVEEQLFSWG